MIRKLYYIYPVVGLMLLNCAIAFAQRRNTAGDEAAAAGGCAICGIGLGAMILIPIIIFVLNIALLVWVARDAKARGLDNSVMWMALVFFTSVIGFIIYYFSRPQGELMQCRHCGNMRLQTSAKCPTCGNA